MSSLWRRDSIIACDGPDREVYCKLCYAKKYGPKGYGFGGGAAFLQCDTLPNGLEMDQSLKATLNPSTTSIKAAEGEGCPRCGGAVYAAEQQLAKGTMWHKRCFSCADCKRPLDSVLACDGPNKEIYCKNCYGKRWGPKGFGYGHTPTLVSVSGDTETPLESKPLSKPTEGEGCARCGFAVYAAEQMISKNRIWHKRCYSCNECHRSLDSTNMNDAPNGEIYCLGCYPIEAAPIYFTIGGVLSDHDNDLLFKKTIDELNFDPTLVPKNTTLYSASMLMDPNPIRTALKVCNYLITQQVYAIVVSHPMRGEMSPAAVSYTGGFYHIPIIGISSRDSAFSDKNIHISFIRTVAPYSHQADVWTTMMRHFSFRQVVIIHSSDTDGNSLLGRFQTHSQSSDEDAEIKIEAVFEFEPELQNFTSQLLEIKEARARVYLLYANKEDASVIFRDATALNMTREGHVWIVTEQALDAPNVPVGVLGLQQINATNEAAHIRDSFYIKKQVLLDGHTGKVAFDENGDRLNAEYEVVNIQSGHQHVSVGQYFYSKFRRAMTLSINDSAIIWPGGGNSKPEGFIIPTHLKVMTIQEKPFVYAREISSDKGELCDVMQKELPCPWFNNSGEGDKSYCCRGYCIDLLQKLAHKINFTFDLVLSPDGQYGNLATRNGTNRKEWTGLIGELVYERADMIVAPLTINPERAQVIEFSKPFKYQGITILEKKQPKTSTLVSFLQPFRDTLWILVMVSVHVVALVLYLLDRFSPFGRFRLANTDATEEDALNLSSAIWFAWGVLLNSGIGEGTPRSFSARVLGMVWAGFAMIIVASYTANLAAFLVLDRPKTSLSGINDPRLRNPMENFTYATVRGSAVDMYFRRQVELSNMYRTMEGNNYVTAEEGIAAVKLGKLKAFIWDSSRLEFEAAQDCDLVTAGELFGRSGYGIGLQKGSPWADSVTLAVLDFHESGLMEDLDTEWILQGNAQQCEHNEKTPATLGLKNMAGVFILVAAGIVGGVALIVIEIMYKRHQIRRQRRLELARHAADKWRTMVEKRKNLRATLESQRRLKSNGVNESAHFPVRRSSVGVASGNTKAHPCWPVPPRSSATPPNKSNVHPRQPDYLDVVQLRRQVTEFSA
nr:EOG090X00ST [Triops cancriformis]